MTIITLPDAGLSNSAARRCKHWIKSVASVDTTKSDGYAFVGQFARFSATVDVADGTWYMSYIEDRTASGRLYGRTVALYQVRGSEVVKVEEWDLNGDAGWALKVRDEIATHMAEPAQPDIDALIDERERLLARIAEIDAMLPEPEGTEVTTREAAKALGVSVRTVQRWAATGKVEAVKDSAGRWVITIIVNA